MKRISRSMLFAACAAAALSAGQIPLAPAALAQDAAAVQAPAQSEDERLAAFFEEVFQLAVAESPMFQAYLGMKTEDYGKWDDFSDAKSIRDFERTKSELERLRNEFDYDALSEQMQVSYRIFEYLQERSIRGHKFRHHAYPFSTMNNPLSEAATFLQNVHSVENVSDAEAYISRLAGFETAVEQLIDNIELSEKIGVVPTSFTFDPIIGDSRNLLKGAPFDDSEEDSALLADFRAKVEALDVSAEEKTRLIEEGKAAMTGPVRQAVETFIAKAESLRAKSPGPHGVWKHRDGKEYYRSQIDFWTSDETLTADELHKIGLADVKRIRGEMEQVMKKAGFEGDLAAFFEFLRSDPSNFFPNTDEGREAYLQASRDYIDSIYEEVDQYFNLMPKAPLEVRRVEPWREDSASTAFYNPASPDGSRPAIYYVNLKDMTKKQKHEMETIAYHEGAPGHHFQNAIQQELEGVPTFQKFAFFGAYAEGWGLYAERLAKEQGRFTDPIQDFGRLQNEMLRAARLVVDTGGHAKKWSREKMIKFMLDNNPMTEEEATKEVERYLDLPGQALSYKVGMMRILDLREKAKRELGDAFDIRDFHDVVLKNGAVPLSVLEELVDDYIADKKAA